MIKKTYIIFIFIFLFACPFFAFADNFPSLKLPYTKGEQREISQGYNTSFTHCGKDKYALDFNLPGEADLGKIILAVADGIAYTKTQRGKKDLYDGYGKYVDIDHGNGYISRYAHLQKFAVRNNQKVKQGQIIGYVNSTGKSTGSHLHFALYKKQNGKYIGVKPEPMSGYRNFVAGQWYTSNNRIYVKSPIEKAKNTIKKVVKVPEGAIVPEGSFSFWDKFLFYTKGFLANYRDFFGDHPIKDTKKQEQRKKNNKKSSSLEKEIWNQKFTGKKVATFTWVKDERNPVDTVSFQFKNTGTKTWFKNKVFLNVIGGYNGTAAKFYYKNWITRLRPCTFKENKVRPGELATFEFVITYPKKIGRYYPQFILSRYDGKKWLTIGKDRAIFLATVKKKGSELVYGSSNISRAITHTQSKGSKGQKKRNKEKPEEEKSILAISQFPMVYYNPQRSGKIPFAGPGIDNLEVTEILKSDYENDYFGTPVVDSKGNIYFSIYVKSGRKGILSLDKSFNERWFFSAEHVESSLSLLENKKTLYAISENKILAINIQNGKLKWESSLAVVFGDQYPILDDNGRLYLVAGIILPNDLRKEGLIHFNNENGKVKWFYDPLEDKTYYNFELPKKTLGHSTSSLLSQPAIDKKGLIYFGYKNNILVLNPKGEKKLERKFEATSCNEEKLKNHNPNISSIVLDEDNSSIYLVAENERYQDCRGWYEGWYSCLHSLNKKTLFDNWNNQPCFQFLKKPALGNNDEVYFAGGHSGFGGKPKMSLYVYSSAGELIAVRDLISYGLINSLVVDSKNNIYILFNASMQIFNEQLESIYIPLLPTFRSEFFSMNRNAEIYVGGHQVLYFIKRK